MSMKAYIAWPLSAQVGWIVPSVLWLLGEDVPRITWALTAAFILTLTLVAVVGGIAFERAR